MVRRFSLFFCTLLAAGCAGDIGDLVGSDTTDQGSSSTTTGGGPDNGSGASADCTGAGLVPQRVRKIADDQYVRLVTDLLPSVKPMQVATPGTESALIKDSQEFVVRGPLASQYWDGAKSAAQQAVVNLQTLVPCSPLPTDAAAQRTCAQKFIDTFGEKAFRRPMGADDSAGLLKVYDVGAGTSFSKGIELVITATLQSADFLYRTELGAPGAAGPDITLTPYEVASVLSFVYLGSGPDAGLLAAAQSGALATDQGVTDQVTRLLGVSAVRDRVTGLVTKVVGADQALTAERDPALYPEITMPVRQAMADEISDFVGTNIWQAHPLADLFTSRQGLVNDTLASWYGMKAVGAKATSVMLPMDQRSGILTRGATILTIPTGSRSVHRGLFIANNYLCRTFSPPPAALLAQVQQTLALGLTERQVSALRASKPQCAACHSNFDSLGLSFEHYDLIGRYITEQAGVPVDASGKLTGTDVDGSFNSVVDLSDLLAKSGDVATCLSREVATQNLGRVLTDSEICSVNQLVKPWRGTDRQLGQLMPLMTTSQFYLHRAKAN